MGRKRNEVVKESNALARSTWAVKSVWAPRILAAAAAQVDDRDRDFSEDGYEIRVADLVRGTGRVLDGGVYDEIRAAIKLFFETPLTWRENGIEHTANAFSHCAFDPSRGVIKVRFDVALRSHYLQLKRHFTLYGIAEYLKLSGLYAQKLYEILKSWSSRKTVTYELAELYRILAVPDSLSGNFAIFVRTVLDKAKNEIERKTELRFTWLAEKEGRKYVRVRFDIQSDGDESADQFVAVETNGEDAAELAKVQRLSVACFERHRSAGTECKPNKGKKCTWCQTRGKMYAHNVLKTVSESESKA